jgi:hypothetical protein
MRDAVVSGMTTQFTHVRSFALLALFASATPALAQDKPKAGLVMNTAGSVSFIFHTSERVALRPELGFSWAKVDNSSLPAESTSMLLTPAISALFYLGPREDLRVYVVPRYAYSRNHGESTSPFGASDETIGTHSFSGSVGAEYSPHRRFGVFGEVGMVYSHSKPVEATTNQNWGVRSVAGAILYF